MPVTPTYPGVYIEELPSGVRTITGVATSVTAFLGRALRGPVNEPTTVNSFADFERVFGGLWKDSMLSYAVQDFYANGGAQALIVRVENGATAATLTLPPESPPSSSDATILEAANPGAWGAALRASVDHATRDPAEDSLFNLVVYEDVEGGVVERFLNVSVDPNDPRYLPGVLEEESSLVVVQKVGDAFRVSAARPAATVPLSPPDAAGTPIQAAGGSDGSAPGTSEYRGSPGQKTGIHALEKADLFNLLCIPPATHEGDTPAAVYQDALAYCERRRAFLVVDPPRSWGASAASAAATARDGLDALGLSGTAARNAALYFPRVRRPDPKRDGQVHTFVPCGMVAGVMARTDVQRGVWKAPAGLDAALNGTAGLQVSLTDAETGMLNPRGINCLRSFPVFGRVVWGARTLRGADQLADEYKYVPVRRLALFLEESLYRGTQWVVFEPNDEPLWAQIRLNVGAFMQSLFRQGAFQGKTPREAYLVKCDSETTTQTDINQGIVNILVGFAPLKPAEFVILKIQQLAGQVEA